MKLTVDAQEGAAISKSPLDGLRVAYAPYDETLMRPADRRRFPYYASKRGLKFEIASDTEAYDLVLVSAGADLTRWARYTKGPVVYDYIDAYLEVPRLDLKGMFRGLAKYAIRQNKYLYIDYWKAIEDLARNASAVICSTAASQDTMRTFCPNTELILDFHSGIYKQTKTTYAAAPVFNIVWEGLGGNLHFMRPLSRILKRLGQKHRIAFHAVTAIEYGAFLGGRVWRKSTVAECRRIFEPSYLYAWNEQTASAVITECDLAVIPVPLDDPMAAAKPANKLLLFWRMGMPVLTSSTEAYVHEMNAAGLSMTCANKEEWEEALNRFIVDEQGRRDAGTKGRSYVETAYAEEAALKKWDSVLIGAANG